MQIRFREHALRREAVTLPARCSEREFRDTEIRLPAVLPVWYVGGRKSITQAGRPYKGFCSQVIYKKSTPAAAKLQIADVDS